jgi:hypothetical protein
MRTSKTPSKLKRCQQISARDQAALVRLRRRFGEAGVRDILRSLPESPRKHSGGAPRMRSTRQCLLAFLYYCKCCKDPPVSVAFFAQNVGKVVEIKYSRRTPPNHISHKTIPALETDVRRGLKKISEKDYRDAVAGLLWWRFIHVNPRWGFGFSGPPLLTVIPKKPETMIAWIDAAIRSAGASPELVSQQYQKNLPHSLRITSDKK